MDIDQVGSKLPVPTEGAEQEKKEEVKEKKEEVKGTKTVELKDIMDGFDKERMAAGWLIDDQIKTELLAILHKHQSEKIDKLERDGYKGEHMKKFLEFKDWAPIQDIFRRFCVTILKACLFKVSEILSLPEGVKLTVNVDEEPEPPKEKGKEKKKKGKKGKLAKKKSSGFVKL